MNDIDLLTRNSNIAVYDLDNTPSFMTYHFDRQGKMAMIARKLAPSAKAGRTPPRQPDYPNELTQDQLDAIRKLVDPKGTRATNRTLLHSPGW